MGVSVPESNARMEAVQRDAVARSSGWLEFVQQTRHAMQTMVRAEEIWQKS